MDTLNDGSEAQKQRYGDGECHENLCRTDTGMHRSDLRRIRLKVQLLLLAL